MQHMSFRISGSCEKKKLDRHVCGIVKKTLEKIGTFVSPTFGALTLGEDGSPEALRSA